MATPNTSGTAAMPAAGAAAATTTSGNNSKQDELPEDSKTKLREIGDQAVWSLSSCKPGFGVDQLRDNSIETYWQSDGTQPHLVNIQFRRKTTVHSLAIYADYKSDESYTPNKISIRIGNNFHDLQEIELLELGQPTGWIRIPLSDAEGKPIRTFMIQIAALSNHQNGRDTHMRQIKVYAPMQDNVFHHIPNFSTVECTKLQSMQQGFLAIEGRVQERPLRKEDGFQLQLTGV